MIREGVTKHPVIVADVVGLKSIIASAMQQNLDRQTVIVSPSLFKHNGRLCFRLWFEN